MPRFVIEPQADSLKGTPEGADGSTWFVPVPEDQAEIFAVIDTEEELIVRDFPTRAAAETWLGVHL
jgi:hypothetical protein